MISLVQINLCVSLTSFLFIVKKKIYMEALLRKLNFHKTEITMKTSISMSERILHIGDASTKNT